MTDSVSSEVAGPSDQRLGSERGRTTIADAVVSRIAGLAAREVDGVHSVGAAGARSVGALRERIPGSRTNVSQGVTVEVGERQAAIDVDIVAEFGVAITDLAPGVRRNVIATVERLTGLEVTEVNLTVQDVCVETDDDHGSAPAPSRVE